MRTTTPHPGRRLLRKLISQPEYQNGTFLPREMEPVLFCERFVYDPGDMAPPGI